MEAKEKVLATMKEAGQPLNAGKIAELSGLDRKEVDAAMKQLKAEGASTVTSTRLTYLDIPVLLKVAPFPGSGFSVEAGPMMGFCVGAKMKNKTHLGDSTNTIKESVRDNVNTVEFGVSLGAQWFFWEDFSIDVRYTLGITQTHNGISNTLGDYYHISVPDNRNSVFQIGTTWTF